MDSISVPVGNMGKRLNLRARIPQPAPRGGATFEVSSGDPSVVVVGDRRRSFLPRVFIPEGQRESNHFTVLGIKVGRTVLRIRPLTPGFIPSEYPVGTWTVNKEYVNLKFLDANPPSNHCRRSNTSPDFSTDPAVLSDCGEPVQGIASDGVSRLLLRTVSGLPGTACYEIVSSSSLDQGSLQTAVTRTQTVRNAEYAFSLYQAPGFYGDTTDSRDVEVEFTFTPSIRNGNTTRFRTKAAIVRPPVVLIHGLWSDNSTWSRDFIRNDRSHTTFAANYQATNDARFANNFDRVKEYVARAIRDHRAKRYATTQADIIAHSMGGLLTRLYIGSLSFKRPENLNQGDIHRLITLDTPHYGSNFANLLVALHRVRPADTATTVANLISAGARVTNGAVCDLSENSPALQGLAGGTRIRGHVITATGGPAGTPANPARFWGSVFGINSFEAELTRTRCVTRILGVCVRYEPLFPQDIVNAFRFREENDAIVPLSSQWAGLPTLNNFQDLLHFGKDVGPFAVVSGVTNTREVANLAFFLLDGPNERLVASFPGVLSDGTGAPRTVPGRGGLLDRQDFSNQCGWGGPMRGTPVPEHPEDQEVVAAAQPQNATSEPQLAADPRVRVTAPVSGQRFAPGDRLSIVVEITPPLKANDIGVDLPGLTHLEGTNYTGSRYEASFVIPDLYAGPLPIVPSITDSNNTPITGVEVTVAVRPATPPSSLFLVQRNYNLTFPTTTTEALHAAGVYPNGVKRDLSSSATGTQYQSSNTAVVRVDSEGVVQVAGPGTAVVTADNSGVTDFATFVVENPLNPLPPEDVTTQVSLAMSGFRLDRQTGFFVQDVTLTSSVPTPIAGPLYLVVTGLTPGVTLVNKSGVTEKIQPTGSPYFVLSLDGDGVTFGPEQTITLQLQFLNPSRLRIDYLFKVFRTSRMP